MNQYEYRVVAAPRKSKKIKGAKTPQDRFARTLGDLINEEARMGWEFVGTETLPADDKKGVLSQTKETFHTVLVFKRFVAAAASSTHVPLKPKVAVAAPSRAIPSRGEPTLRTDDLSVDTNSPRVGPASDG